MNYQTIVDLARAGAVIGRGEINATLDAAGVEMERFLQDVFSTPRWGRSAGAVFGVRGADTPIINQGQRRIPPSARGVRRVRRASDRIRAGRASAAPKIGAG